MTVKAPFEACRHTRFMERRADPGSLAHRIGHEGIAAVVDAFYTRIQHHPSLAAPFGIVEDWPHHKEKLTHFWWVLLGGDPYLEVDYSVPMKHFKAGFTDALLGDWLELFGETQRELLPPDQADDWLHITVGMGANLSRMNAAIGERAARPA